jgi:hypothetical protein
MRLLLVTRCAAGRRGRRGRHGGQSAYATNQVAAWSGYSINRIPGCENSDNAAPWSFVAVNNFVATSRG